MCRSSECIWAKAFFEPGPKEVAWPWKPGPDCALPKAVALVSPARRAQTFKILGFFSEAEEARLQYKTES